MTVQVIHVFYDVSMHWNHDTLMSVLEENTKKARLAKGELALFMNASWTACKLLTTQSLLYYRAKKGYVTVEHVRFLPCAYGGPKLTFSKNLETKLIEAFEKATGGYKAQDLKVAFA